MPIAKLWKTAPSTTLTISAQPDADTFECSMDIDMTVLATQSSLHEHKSRSDLAAGFPKLIEEGVVYSFNLLATPKDASKGCKVKVDIVASNPNPNSPLPGPDRDTYAFSATIQAWTWKIF